MEAIIHNYRRNRHTQNLKHMIMELPGVDSREKTEKFMGKKVTFTTETGNKISGEIKAPHGNKGCVRVIFPDKGLPGQSLGTKVKVE